MLTLRRSSRMFEYDETKTYTLNFNEWHWLNTEERLLYKEEALSAEEAEELFDQLYGDFK